VDLPNSNLPTRLTPLKSYFRLRAEWRHVAQIALRGLTANCINGGRPWVSRWLLSAASAKPIRPRPRARPAGLHHLDLHAGFEAVDVAVLVLIVPDGLHASHVVLMYPKGAKVCLRLTPLSMLT
jgi:hypothetical protein